MKPFSPSFSALSGPERAAALLDPGTAARLGSTSDDGSSPVWAGGGFLAGRRVLLAVTDGHIRGGTLGIRDAELLVELSAAATQREPAAIVICWDTGGVRVEEGPVALATASAVGVALARLSLLGTPVFSIISGPRGCFGAPSVIAALSKAVIMTNDAHWGLTGPKLLLANGDAAEERLGWTATSAIQRRRAGQADAVVADSPAAVRDRLAGLVSRASRRAGVFLGLDRSVRRTERLCTLARTRRPPSLAVPPHRHRDLLRFSFRGHWRPTGPIVRRGLAHAAWGVLDGQPALGIIVGSDRTERLGIGVEEAHAITEMIRFAVDRPAAQPAPILTFLFCQGHAVELGEEQLGLHAALAECMKSFVAARLLGHPLLCVLGGGAYGAAYLSLAAPSHRVLALRGTTVAPMAPHVLAAFQRLRGLREAPDTPANLAELIPEVRIVESIIRLPRALREELDAVTGIQPELPPGARRRRVARTPLAHDVRRRSRPSSSRSNAA